ncbi:hypothetical protein AS593_07370 [Caulobacter vibrioides]|nr:hypothetical protein AS593_07370 [Caulobacter vibrioides]
MSPRSLAVCAAALAAAALAAPTWAQEVRLTPSEIAGLAKGGAGAGTSGVAGIRTTILHGDPTKAGPYTIEIRVPPHTRIAAHSHQDDRTAVVASGLWFFGYGKKNQDPLVKALPAGSFYTEPAGLDHFAQTRDQPASVYIFGFGPTSTDYVEAADTPGR